MKVYRSTNSLPVFKNPVVTIGTFDGVHEGHRQLIKKIKNIASEIKGESVLITFDPHPRFVIHPEEKSLRILSTLEEKIALLNAEGVDHLVIIPFTKEFSMYSARDYIREFLVAKFHPAVIVTGYNHSFGHHRDGNIEMLKKYAEEFNYRVEELSKQIVDEIAVSSTRVRIALSEGDFETARHLLGHDYTLKGTVVRGQQLGNKIGFPTANIEPNSDFKLIPADGVYAVRVSWNENLYTGMMNIGFRPTVDGLHHKLEVHLFNFGADIYSQQIEIQFVKRLRDEKKFSSLDELKIQLGKDRDNAIQIFSSLPL